MKRRFFCKGALMLAATGAAGEEASILRGDLAALRASMQGKLLLPGEQGYDTARRLWNGAFDHKPALIARCARAEDVARAVDFARESRLPLAVRGGGHSFPGHSSCDGGLMIDLSSMRSVNVDRAARHVRIGPGVLLGELDRAAQSAGLVTSTGTVSQTGAAGLTLGGGFGRMARRFGLACDNLIAAEVVTADGRQVRANGEENRDLFWGLRGGGGNFGVVTSFEYALHAMPDDIIGGLLVFPFTQPRAFLRAFAEFAAEASDDFFAMADIVPTPGGQWIFAIEVCHSGPRDTAERELATLRKLGAVAQDSLRSTSYVELQSRIDTDYPAGRGYYLKSGFVRDITPDLIDGLVDYLEAAPGSRRAASFIQLGGAISRVKPDATAYWHRDAGWHAVLVGTWDEASQAEASKSWVRTAWKKIEPLTDGFYVNFMAPDDAERRVRNTYGANYDRLAALKKLHDPTNLFRRNANIRPATATART